MTGRPGGPDTEPASFAGGRPNDVAALARLAGFRLRAAFRTRARRLASARGVLSVLAIVAVGWFVVRSLHGAHAFGAPAVPAVAARDGTLLSLGLLGGVLFTVLTSTGPALHFSPAEMNILFSAPLRRHVLVLYRYASYLFGALLSAGLLVLLIPPAEIGRLRMFLAVLFTLVFVQLASTVVSCASSIVRRRWPMLPGRRIAIVALLLAAGLVGAYLLLGRSTPGALLTGLVASPIARIALAPFGVFAGLYVPGESMPELVARLALASLMLAALLALIIRLDEHLHEEISSASLAAHARWQSILAGGSLWGRKIGAVRSRRSPRRPPGIAPIGWSQALRLWRTGSPMALGLLGLALIGGALLGASASVVDASGIAAGLFFAFAFLLPRVAVHDFRGAPRIIELLQTLPSSDRAICLGMIATPTLSALLLQWSMIAAAMPFADTAHVPWLLALAIALVPFTLLQYALENLLFLLMPTRLVPVGRLDFDFLGRTLLEFFLKSVVLVAAVAVAAGAGVACLFAWPGHPLSSAAVAVLVLCLQAAAVVGALTLAYRRFDSSLHALG